MILHDCEQQSEEWFRLRIGIPTTSEFSKIVTPTGKLSAQADGYMHWLLAEWICGHPLENPETRWMERGHDLEPQAVKSYEFERDSETEKIGFVTTDDGMIGCSPDRLVGSDGLLEIKCPAPQTHVGYMLNRSVDKAYWPQVQGQLFVTERGWVDIQSYCPGFPTVIIRVERDENYLATLGEALRGFVANLMAARCDLETRYGPFVREPEPEQRNALEESLGLTDADLEALIHHRRER